MAAPRRIGTNAARSKLWNRVDDELFFSLNAVAGVAIPVGEYRVFNQGIGNDIQFMNAAAEYPLLPCDTNLVGNGGQMIQNTWLMVKYIEIRIRLLNDVMTDPFSGDNSLVIDSTPSGAGVLGADQGLLALMENTTFALYRDQNRPVINEALLDSFPTMGGLIGHTGTADGVTQNGMFVRKYVNPFAIESLQSYYGIWRHYRSTIIASDFKAYFVLGGRFTTAIS